MPALAGPLTLQEALELAARHNIEVWLAAQQRKVEQELATHSLLKMLPSLLAGGESSRRSEYEASSSESLATGQESLEPSFSSEKEVNRWDVSGIWNLLDFGISYLRARQQANRVLIAAERERRVRQNLALEVTRTWWQAVTAREVARQADELAERVAAALDKLGRQVAEKAISEVDGLKRETMLLEQQEELERYKRSYLAAKAELAALIGLPPGADLSLAEVDLEQPPSPAEFDVEELEREALRRRPELYEKDLEEAISRDEARLALAQMLPSVSLFWRFDHDNNRYLAFKHWHTAGIRASWDLLTIPQQLAHHGALKHQTELVIRQRLAVAVAILTQLQLALIDYTDTAERLTLARAIADRHQALLLALQSAAGEGKSHGGETLDQELKALKARARYLTGYAALMTAEARVWSTIGRDVSAASSKPRPTTIAPSAAEGPEAGVEIGTTTQPCDSQPAP